MMFPEIILTLGRWAQQYHWVLWGAAGLSIALWLARRTVRSRYRMMGWVDDRDAPGPRWWRYRAWRRWGVTRGGQS